MSKTYWFTRSNRNLGVVWAGRKNEQRYVDDRGVGISIFGECYNSLNKNDPFYMKHKTYKAACAYANIKPVRIKWCQYAKT